MKIGVKQDGMWWSWIETCNKCGKLIHNHSIQYSSKPDIEEADFCAECIRSLIDNNIPYEEAKQQYMVNT